MTKSDSDGSQTEARRNKKRIDKGINPIQGKREKVNYN